MRLESAFLAQAATVLPDGRFFVFGGGIDGFVGAELPIIVPSVSAVARIHFSPEDCGVEHELLATFAGPPESEPGFNAGRKFKPVLSPYLPDRGTILPFVVDITNLRLTHEGLYTVSYSAGDTLLGKLTYVAYLARAREREGE